MSRPCALMFVAMAAPLLAADSAEETLIRQLIEKAYVHGAFNEQNTVDMAMGFHRELAIFSAKGTDLGRYAIGSWIEGIEKRKTSSDYDPNRSKMDHKISKIDVTGGAAHAKVELSKNGKLIYTDYLSFIRFACPSSGLRMVGKSRPRFTTGTNDRCFSCPGHSR